MSEEQAGGNKAEAPKPNENKCECGNDIAFESAFCDYALGLFTKCDKCMMESGAEDKSFNG